MSVRYCLDCNKPIEGRSDKKFCSPYCKSSYHFRKNKENGMGLFKKIDHQIKLNRKLLKTFNKAGKSTVAKEVLLKEGFNPRYCTHSWQNQKGLEYCFCYEYGFTEIRENGRSKYLLIVWQKYMDL